MARYYGNIGFGESVDIGNGVWEERITPKPYYGDVINSGRRWESGASTNDNLVLQNNISIIADKFALENIGAMKWVEWNGVKWKITSVTIERPRIRIFFGGVYND